MSKVKILLVEDHVVMRQGLKALFTREADLEVVGEASNGREALALTRDLQPDVVLTDISMPYLNGIETTRQIQRDYPWVKVLILSMHLSEDYIFQALQAGAVGYILKQCDSTELVNAVRAAHRGDFFFSASISRIVRRNCLHRDKIRRLDNNRTDTLTTREREVLQPLAEGLPNRDIAKLLGISVKTVERHRSNMMHKLGVTNKTELIRYALKKGLTTLEG